MAIKAPNILSIHPCNIFQVLLLPPKAQKSATAAEVVGQKDLRMLQPIATTPIINRFCDDVKWISIRNK
jgi:hypothetical protein